MGRLRVRLDNTPTEEEQKAAAAVLDGIKLIMEHPKADTVDCLTSIMVLIKALLMTADLNRCMISIMKQVGSYLLNEEPFMLSLMHKDELMALMKDIEQIPDGSIKEKIRMRLIPLNVHENDETISRH